MEDFLVQTRWHRLRKSREYEQVVFTSGLGSSSQKKQSPIFERTFYSSGELWVRFDESLTLCYENPPAE